MKKGVMGRDAMRAQSPSLARLQINEGDPYQNLANAIVCVAADDYRTALKQGDKPLVDSLHRFFQSSWCGVLTGINTERLIAALHREHRGQLATINI